MNDWDPEQMSDHFRAQADDAERYTKEVRGKLSRTDTYCRLFDEHWARFYVFDALSNSSHLASREQLISYLNQMLNTRPTPFGACDADYFEAQRIACIKQIISEITV